MKAIELAEKAVQALEEKKCINPVLFDVRNRPSVTDYYLVVSGTSGPHLKAMSVDLQKSLKEHGVYCFRKSGDPDHGWIALDYVDLVIHIFSEEKRKYYAIEDLWREQNRLEPAE